ncbi:glycosyltransferase family 4 protein [Thiorhodococcus fuscus]|uniref:Glycosyltransferase family 4 protein n=1 Tax=Thiorhodococcus fuscus TaxID=527200 RepID=A0ABW4Y6F3_9GAMM
MATAPADTFISLSHFPMRKVVIVQRVLPHYRVAFFSELRLRLLDENIDMRLAYGQELPGQIPRTVDLIAPWAIRVQNRYLPLGPVKPVWQPCLNLIEDADLVIIEQANALLLNHWLMLRRALRARPLVAFWGHGSNRQAAHPDSLSEQIKRRLITRVDWWFAYTRLSARLVREAGFPPERITIVNNTLDTGTLRRDLAAVTPAEQATARRRLELRPNDRICLYSGGLYPDKRLDFLIQAGAAIHARLPDFRLLIIGDGPERERIDRAARTHPWLRYLGPLFGADRAIYYRLGQAFLMPGLVGLVIIDSFATGLPLFTLDDSPHSPEIAYLKPGENGYMTPPDVTVYAAAVCAFLEGGERSANVRSACLESGRTLTLERMVAHYATGITRCLRDNIAAGQLDDTPPDQTVRSESTPGNPTSCACF